MTEPSQSPKGKIVIMCFDGTGYEPGQGNSNVVRLFRALKECKEQITYYQPGVGTYSEYTGIMGKVAATLDSAVAWNLDEHVKEGYTYLVQNFQRGDKICLFGFSRGAHTARVLAGMIYKVGILRKDNLQQINFALNIFMSAGYHGYKLSQEFKSTFAIHADVEFVGVWDTVSSVGIISQTHPYTSINYSAKCVRHALALDERRAKFRPDMWCEPVPGRGHELDINFPIPEYKGNGAVARDNWKYEPPNRDYADVKEVWFAGAHADVGGSTRHNRILQFIPLRWMIKECILARTGIQFDMEYLRDYLNFDFQELSTEMEKKKITSGALGTAGQDLERYKSESSVQEDLETIFSIQSSMHEAFDRVFDPLILIWFWWILEIIPFLTTRQDSDGNWIRLRICNFGSGRYIPFHKGKVLVHKSVDQRIDKHNYKPKAFNWKEVVESGMLSYVS